MSHFRMLEIISLLSEILIYFVIFRFFENFDEFIESFK